MVRAFYAAATTTAQVSTSAQIPLTTSTKRAISLASHLARRMPDSGRGTAPCALPLHLFDGEEAGLTTRVEG
jgi:hypothetical protein